MQLKWCGFLQFARDFFMNGNFLTIKSIYLITASLSLDWRNVNFRNLCLYDFRNSLYFGFCFQKFQSLFFLIIPLILHGIIRIPVYNFSKKSTFSWVYKKSINKVFYELEFSRIFRIQIIPGHFSPFFLLAMDFTAYSDLLCKHSVYNCHDFYWYMQ